MTLWPQTAMSTQKHEDWLHFVKHFVQRFHFISKDLWVLLTAIIGGRADYRRWCGWCCDVLSFLNQMPSSRTFYKTNVVLSHKSFLSKRGHARLGELGQADRAPGIWNF